MRVGQKRVEAELRESNECRGDKTGEIRRISLSFSAEFGKHSCDMEEIGRRVDDVTE